MRTRIQLTSMGSWVAWVAWVAPNRSQYLSSLSQRRNQFGTKFIITGMVDVLRMAVVETHFGLGLELRARVADHVIMVVLRMAVVYEQVVQFRGVAQTLQKKTVVHVVRVIVLMSGFDSVVLGVNHIYIWFKLLFCVVFIDIMPRIVRNVLRLRPIAGREPLLAVGLFQLVLK